MRLFKYQNFILYNLEISTSDILMEPLETFEKSERVTRRKKNRRTENTIAVFFTICAISVNTSVLFVIKKKQHTLVLKIASYLYKKQKN